MQFLGVPYPEGYASKALADLQKQADEVAATIPGAKADREIIALIAYMHKVGSGISVQNNK